MAHGKYSEEHIYLTYIPIGSLREKGQLPQDWQLSFPEPCCVFQHSSLTFNVKTLANLKKY